ncbi:MAG: NfeD family protein [Bryobacteraceae bacterium]|nr:NfeD family protein [Bryobacteraceae bacterium]
MSFSWWSWVLLGFVLLLVELATPGGFYIFFFGGGAIVVGLLAALGIAGPLWVQCLLFAIISCFGLLVLRRPLQNRFRVKPHDVDSIVGETAVAMNAIGVAAIGKAELRGTSWSARNTGAEAIAQGQRCRVERVDGLMLHIRG